MKEQLPASEHMIFANEVVGTLIKHEFIGFDLQITVRPSRVAHRYNFEGHGQDLEFLIIQPLDGLNGEPQCMINGQSVTPDHARAELAAAMERAALAATTK